jgi:hypothetical protein
MKIRNLDSSKAWDYENAFYWFSHPSRIDKVLAQYELYKKITSVPGKLLEFGVYKGLSLIRFAQYRRLLETDTSREIVGFDIFGKFPVSETESKSNKDFASDFENRGGEGLSINEIANIFSEKKIENVSLIPGDIFESLPRYLNEFPETSVALLHLDVDIYEPTKYILENCYERVVRGGLIIIDDYNSVEGATRAVNEFINKHNLMIHKMPYYNVPAFIIKS